MAKAPKAAEPTAPKSVKKPRKAFTLERAAKGWALVTVTYQDEGDVGEIVEIERSQPDLKMIMIEKFKLAALRYWTAID